MGTQPRRRNERKSALEPPESTPAGQSPLVMSNETHGVSLGTRAYRAIDF